MHVVSSASHENEMKQLYLVRREKLRALQCNDLHRDYLHFITLRQYLDMLCSVDVNQGKCAENAALPPTFNVKQLLIIKKIDYHHHDEVTIF